MTLRVSVVVPTRGRPQLLERCLQSLLAQNLDPTRYEVVVVHDGPEDAPTREVIDRCQQRLEATPVILPVTGKNGSGKKNGHRVVSVQVSRMPGADVAVEVETRVVAPSLRYLRTEQSNGPAAARNLGWRSADADIIAFTDDDTLPDPGWLRAGLAAFVGDVAGVSGRVVVPLPLRPTDHERNTAGLESSLFVTANCFYRRAALEETGGFDERFTAAWREDSDLFFTLQERGYLLAQSPEAVVLHPPRPAPWGSSLSAQRKSVYNALLYKKHPLAYRKILQASPPWHYYWMLLAFALAIVSLLAGQVVGAAFLFSFWGGMVLHFCLRRLAGTSRAPSHVAEMIITSIFIPPLSVYWRLRGAFRYRVWFF